MKEQAKKDALDYLTKDIPIKYPELVTFLLKNDIPEQIPFDMYIKHENNIKELYKITKTRSNDKAILQFILHIIDKYQKYVVKIKNFALCIKNKTNTTLSIIAYPTTGSKNLRLNLLEQIPVIDTITHISSNNIPLHMLDIDTADDGYATIKFNDLFKNIKPNDYLIKPAPHSANYYMHKDDILIPHYEHTMTDETEKNIGQILAKAITEKMTTGKDTLSDKDMIYINKAQYTVTNNKKEDGYQSTFTGYTQNKTYDDELCYYDNTISKETIIKILTAVVNII